MNEPKEKPIAQEAYDELAEAYAARVDTKPHNAYYERPATLSLLPDVAEKRVLDAGCGPGIYAVGHYFGEMVLASPKRREIIERYAGRMRRNSFEAILVMHLLSLPDDPINLLAGFLNVDRKAFAAATFLGGLPGTVAFVLLGASIEGRFEVQSLEFNTGYLLASAVLLILSVSLSAYVRYRSRKG